VRDALRRWRSQQDAGGGLAPQGEFNFRLGALRALATWLQSLFPAREKTVWACVKSGIVRASRGRGKKSASKVFGILSETPFAASKTGLRGKLKKRRRKTSALFRM